MIDTNDNIPATATKIEISLSRLSQLFNSLDPSPFHERDLDHDAEDYIVGSAEEAPRQQPLSCQRRACQTCVRQFTITSRIAAIKSAAAYGCCSAMAVSRCSSALASCFAAYCCGNWPLPSAMTALRIFSERAC